MDSTRNADDSRRLDLLRMLDLPTSNLEHTLEKLGAVIHRVLAGGLRLGMEPLQMSTR